MPKMRVAIVAAVTIDAELVAAIAKTDSQGTGHAGGRIEVMGWNLMALTAAVTFYFKSGTTQISGSRTLATNAVSSQAVGDQELFSAVVGQALNIDITTTGGSLTGDVYYRVT